MLQLPEAGQETGSVCAELPSLSHHAVLDGEPVQGGQALHLLVGSSQGSLSDALRQVGKLRNRQHWGMAHQLVHDVGLGCVVGLARVPDVLGGTEAPVRQRAEKVARTDQPGNGL